MLMPSGTNQIVDTIPAKHQIDPSGKQKRKKRRLDKEKFTSLTVASMKRLLPIGMNTFGEREQELVQLAKHKMIEGEIVNKNNWQSALYRKISSKSHRTGIIHSQDTSIKTILIMAEALFGLNFIDHPSTHRNGT